MRLISEVDITGFRSLRSVKKVQFGDFTALAGLNNSGKSNVLRALNAFFNGETDPGQSLRVDHDYYKPDLGRKKAKEISVSVTFTLPDHFRFRKGLEHVGELLGARTFKIMKTWKRGMREPKYVLGGKEMDATGHQRIDQFLQLINFRYIPNRVIPIDVIKQERNALRDVLVRRIGRRSGEHQEAFEAIRETSDKLIKALVERLKKASPDLGEVRLATPTSWADMVFTFGYKLAGNGFEVDDAVQGAGIQSLLMLETLYLIDRDYFQKFGWKQAAVWAIEEPESSLHTTLEAYVASYLSSIATDPASRLQVLCTTHSDLMVQYAKTTVLVSKHGDETKCESGENPRDTLGKLSKAGVSRWVHPLLHFPLDPIIIVDGKYDHVFWTEALKLTQTKREPIVTYLERIDPSSGSGGNSNTFAYIKANANAIKSRRKTAPVAVVLDWDDAKKVQNYKRLFREGDPFLLFCWPESEANPRLSKAFRGTERFCSDRIVDQARKEGLEVAEYADGRLTVETNHYNTKGKTAICNVIKKGLNVDDLKYAKSFMEKVLREIGVM